LPHKKESTFGKKDFVLAGQVREKEILSEKKGKNIFALKVAFCYTT